jgi:hypothetical protein
MFGTSLGESLTQTAGADRAKTNAAQMLQRRHENARPEVGTNATAKIGCVVGYNLAFCFVF